MKESTMAKQYEILDRHGRLVEGDIIPDGGRLRVSMMMKDSMSPVQRAVAEDAEARRFPVVDAFGRPAGRRPGACYLRPAADGSPERAAQIARDHMRQEAYEDSVRDLEDAWRQPSPTSPAEPRASVTGSGGARGQMRIPDERQDCVPRTMSLADAQAIRDAAYEQSVRELTDAWKAR
jgi:hypothetical protein